MPDNLRAIYLHALPLPTTQPKHLFVEFIGKSFRPSCEFFELISFGDSGIVNQICVTGQPQMGCPVSKYPKMVYECCRPRVQPPHQFVKKKRLPRCELEVCSLLGRGQSGV